MPKRKIARPIRAALGARMRALRKERRFSQERLGKLAHLSGKFIGEVERGEKSISIDSLSRVAEALGAPLAQLTRLEASSVMQDGVREDAERMYAIMSRRSPAELEKAYRMLKILFGK